MAISPLLLSLVGGVLVNALEKSGGVGTLLGGQTPPAGGDLPDPVPLPPEVVAELTDVKDDTRSFKPGVAEKIRAMLAGRSLAPVEGHALSQLGSAWRVVRLQEGAPNAAEVVASAEWAIGALTLPLLSIGRDDIAMAIVTGGRHLEALAANGGHFAVLSRPLPVEVKPPPVKATKADVEKVVKNGAAKKAAPVVIEAETAKEDGIH